MKRFTITTVLALLVFSTALASYDLEEVRVEPTVLGEDEHFILWGRVENSDLTSSLPSNELRVELLDGDGDHVRFVDTEFHADDGNDEALSTGVFLSRINTDDLSSHETYFLRAKINGMTHYSSGGLSLQDVERNATIQLLNPWLDENDFHATIKIVNEKDYDQNVTLTLIGGSEQSLNTTILASETKYVDLTRSFSELDINTGANILVAKAVHEPSSGGANGEALPSHAVIMRGTRDYSQYYDARIISEEEVIRKETINNVPINIENTGGLVTTYDLSIISGELKEHASMSAQKITLNPGETGTANLVITVPSNTTLENTGLGLRAEFAGKSVEKTLTLNVEEKAKKHYFTINKITVNKDAYVLGEDKFVNGTIRVENKGDYSERINVEYEYENGPTFTTGINTIQAGSKKNVPFYLPLPQETSGDDLRLVFRAVSDDYEFTARTNLTITKPVYNFFIQGGDYEEPITVGEKKNLSFQVFNIGFNDTYSITSDWAYSDLPEDLTILQGGYKKITITVHAPEGQGLVGEEHVNVRVCSQESEECKTKRYLLKIEEEQPGTGAVTFPEKNTLTFNGGTQDYEFMVKNTGRTTKNYQVQITGLPEESYTLLPGSDEVVYRNQSLEFTVRITDLEAGFHDATISVYEEGVPLGTQELSVQSQPERLTGGVTGVFAAGVPILFILILGVLVAGWAYMRREEKQYDYWEERKEEKKESSTTQKMKELRNKILGFKEKLSAKQVKPYDDYIKKV